MTHSNACEFNQLLDYSIHACKRTSWARNAEVTAVDVTRRTTSEDRMQPLTSIIKSIQQLRMRRRRQSWLNRAMGQVTSCKSPPKVNGPTVFQGTVHLGHNTNFNGMVIAGGGSVTIGDNFHSGIECRMLTQIHDYDGGDTIPYGKNYLYKEIVIEDNVWFGDRVMVLGSVRIGEGAIIQAGSVVVTNIPKYAIAGGHPAKQFKSRDVEHYERLKAEGRFL